MLRSPFFYSYSTPAGTLSSTRCCWSSFIVVDIPINVLLVDAHFLQAILWLDHQNVYACQVSEVFHLWKIMMTTFFFGLDCLWLGLTVLDIGYGKLSFRIEIEDKLFYGKLDNENKW